LASQAIRALAAGEYRLEPGTRSHSTPGAIENSAPLAALMLCTVQDHT